MKFCRGPFWNTTMSWDTDYPRFTHCFQDTVILGVPCLILWLGLPFWLKWIFRQKQRSFPRPRKKMYILVAKIFGTAFMFFYSIYKIYDIYQRYQEIFPGDIVGPIVMTFSYFLNGIVIILERRLDIHSSVLLFYFWLVHFILSVPALVEDVENYLQQIDSRTDEVEIILALSIIKILFTFLNLILHSISDQYFENHLDQVPPESKSSHFSNLLWSWMDGIIYKGYKQPLVQSDVPKPPHYLNVSKNNQEFHENWIKSQNKAEISRQDSNNAPQISIWPVILQTYGLRTIFSIILNLIRTLMDFVDPLILGLLIDHVKETKDEEEWKGYFYLAILFSNNFFSSIFHAFCYQQMCIVNIQMESTLTSAIYKKSLKLSNKARSKYTIGEITNYMSVDCQRVHPQTISDFLNLPLTCSIALYLLYNLLGWSGLGGIIVVLALIPSNYWVTTKVAEIEEEGLEVKDVRTKLMNEILAGIKVLKLYAWEIPLMKRVLDARNREMDILKRFGKIVSIEYFASCCSPFLITCTVFMIYVFTDPLNHILDAKKIFVSISILDMFKEAFQGLPWAVTETIQIFISIRRINRFLNAEELNPDMIGDQMENPDNIIEIQNASFLAGSGDSEQLKNISVEIKSGSLTAIVGHVGCGKSLLLQSILGEIDKTNGSINIGNKNNLKIAYVPQQVWIQNMTLKNNILFNNSNNEMEYNRVVDACAMKSDLEILPAGDNTEIGESGINLSGGQKQRIGIARAVYSNADLYLLDDPLSAVDAHVGKQLFENVLHSKTGLLKDKTRLVATNNLNILQDMDNIIVLKEGSISEQGTYYELVNNGGTFAEYLNQYINNSTTETIEENKVDKFIPRSINRTRSDSRSSIDENDSKSFQRSPSDAHDEPIIIGDINEESDTDEQVINQEYANTDDEGVTGRLIEEEEAQTGKVRYGVYLDYFRNFGWLRLCIILSLIASGEILDVCGDFWLSHWSNFNEHQNGTDIAHNLGYFLGIYSVFELSSAFGALFLCLLLFNFIAGASNKIHYKLLHSVMRSPMSFFDTNPTGRIINRFTTDIDTIDNQIPHSLLDFFWSVMSVIGNLFVISFSTPQFLYVIIPLFIVYIFIQRCYVKSRRQLKRLSSISKSPIFSHFTESVNGATTIRAFGLTEHFISESESKVGAMVGIDYYSFAAGRWFSIRIDGLGNLLIFFATLFAIINRETLSPGLAGLSISNAMTITGTLNVIVNVLVRIENDSVAFERLLEYINGNQHEASWESEVGYEPDQDWPQEGKIQFLDYNTQYRPGLELVLKDITMKIDKETKIGICGRTGAGKSSLTMALFRIIEPVSGSIIIDGKDISRIGLHDLRSRLTIIPQDPILFTGSIRFNLDPTGLQSDQSLWIALEQSNLKNHIEYLGKGLDYEIAEGGSNFSVGQKQLICLARAILRKTKILVLDEATAAIDMETDDLIQNTIRLAFNDCTVITIAHRLNTIQDSDAIAVLSNGKLIEYDNPSILLNQNNSAFKSMFDDSLIPS